LAEIGTYLTGPDLPLTELVERPADGKARSLAKRSMATLARGTNSNPVLFAKLNTMHEQEPAVQERTDITLQVMAFSLAATKENQLAVYERYLDAGEMAFVRANLGKRNGEWPPLFARVRTAMDEGRAPDSPQAQALANEPELKQPGMVDERMLGFIRAAMQSLQRTQPAP
jgi:hypothetical protein